MISLFRVILLVVSVAITVLFYYLTPVHGYEFSQWSNGFWGYIIFVAIVYGGWKFFSHTKKDPSIRPIWFAIFALLNLLVLSLIYFAKVGDGYSAVDGVIMFSRLLGLFIVPVILMVVTYSFGRFVISRCFPKEGDEALTIMTSTVIWWAIFMSLNLIIALIVGYHISVVAILLCAMAIVSYRELLQFFRWSIEPMRLVKNTSQLFGIDSYRLSGELAYLVSIFLLWVNWISAFRAAPIGWDDSGVYMNVPRIMALSNEAFQWGGMLAWPTVTGIGYLMERAAQAFMINQIGGVLIIIMSLIWVRYLIRGYSASLNYGALVGMTLLAMPMIVFQQAKDMKIDPMLLGLSLAVFFVVIEITRRTWEERDSLLLKVSDHFANRQITYWWFVIGIMIGLLFTVKLTSLIFIIAALALLAYASQGILAFFGLCFGVVGIFSIGGFWLILNVVTAASNTTNIFFGCLCLLISVALLAYKFPHFSLFISRVGAFLGGLVLVLSPWLVKNSLELIASNQAFTPLALISGYGDDAHAFRPDYRRIYNEDQIKDRQKTSVSSSLNSDGQSANEDFGRYFGYETGLNNFFKLPLNLTLQSNQPGEYTEIGYIFFALIPVILVFFQYTSPGFATGIITCIWVFSLLLYIPVLNVTLTSVLARITLPWGYLVISVAIFLPFLGLHYALRRSGLSRLVQIVAGFSAVYGTLFLVSAYGIVWYGIMIYPAMLVAIVLAALHLERAPEDREESVFNKKVALAIIVLAFAVYPLRSALPHGWNNLLAFGYPEYKSARMDETTSIFAYRPDYVDILATLNIDVSKPGATEALAGLKADDLVERVSNVKIREILRNNNAQVSVARFAAIAWQIAHTFGPQVASQPLTERAELRAAINQLHTLVTIASDRLEVLLNPDELKSDAKIYRIGTFLTYYISQNTARYFDDSLVFLFDQWLADNDIDVTVERMKALGLKYLLVDLNAATIDQDPRHALTTRFEKLLATMQSPRLKLISSDSICLKLAREIPGLSSREFVRLAGVNYESYQNIGWQEQVITRTQKTIECRNTALRLYNSGLISATNYPSLLPLKNQLDALITQAGGGQPNGEQVSQVLITGIPDRSWMALFEIQ